MPLTIYAHPNHPRLFKALVTAKLAGVSLAAKTPQEADLEKFAKLNFVGEVKSHDGRLPVLVSDEGHVLYQVNAILRYLARIGNNKTLYEQEGIDSWLDFSLNEVDLPTFALTYQIDGFIEKNDALVAKVQSSLEASLQALNRHLQRSTWLVGQRLTLADVAVSLSYYRVFGTLFSGSQLKSNFPHVYRWYLTCVNQPQFSSVIGQVNLSAQPQARVHKPQAQQAAKGQPTKSHASHASHASHPPLAEVHWSNFPAIPLEALITTRLTSSVFQKETQSEGKGAETSPSFLRLSNGQTIFGSFAIARYLALRNGGDEALYPSNQNALLVSEIEQWISFSRKLKTNFAEITSLLNTQLQLRTFIHGVTLYLSDVTLWVAYKEHKWSDEEKKKFPHVLRWFNYLQSLPAFQF
eukprot:TRINITY_DN108_c0_g1_i1.p1 TRINITY_DN108_c0_g1~~TRINITY_DN108_c0_g1_i1.p1  ORF type:complete len:425 (-),score=157.39 TRINITY_DN108_c0_g1_i1:121-1347(-)